MVAHIELSGSCIRVELVSSPLATLPLVSSSSSSPSPEQTLLDTIILVTLLVTANADSIPVRRSARRPTISSPRPYHVPIQQHFLREDIDDSRVSDVSFTDTASFVKKNSEQLSPHKPRHAFDLRREAPQYCSEDEEGSYSQLLRPYDLLPPPYTPSPTPIYSAPPSPRGAQHFGGASKIPGLFPPPTASRI